MPIDIVAPLYGVHGVACHLCMARVVLAVQFPYLRPVDAYALSPSVGIGIGFRQRRTRRTEQYGFLR